MTQVHQYFTWNNDKISIVCEWVAAAGGRGGDELVCRNLIIDAPIFQLSCKTHKNKYGELPCRDIDRKSVRVCATCALCLCIQIQYFECFLIEQKDNWMKSPAYHIIWGLELCPRAFLVRVCCFWANRITAWFLFYVIVWSGIPYCLPTCNVF